jgi:hypothetical protein
MSRCAIDRQHRRLAGDILDLHIVVEEDVLAQPLKDAPLIVARSQVSGIMNAGSEGDQW